MVHISEHDAHYTTITVFSTTPDNQMQLFELLRDGEESIRSFDGLIAACLHLSHDKHSVIGYAQWESEDAFRAMRARPGGQEHFARVRELVTGVDLVSCRPVYTATQAQ